jgi:riboflavin synthase
VIALPGPDGRIDLAALLDELARREVNELHVEAGPTLNAALMQAGLIDEWLLYLAPKLMGPGRPMAALPPGAAGSGQRTELSPGRPRRPRPAGAGTACPYPGRRPASSPSRQDKLSMFTGIITGVGRIVALQDLGSTNQHGKRLHIEAPAGYLDDVGLGDSIALNGACMTVTSLPAGRPQFTVDVSAESLDKTCGLDRIGPINLEKALRANDRLGGHIVSGHVDGLGRVTRFEQVGESWELRIAAPAELARFLAYKGSITINGVSLTVNQVRDDAQGAEISINLIPHTVSHTSLHVLQTGDAVNLEIDTVARYVERMLSSRHK